MRFFAARTPGAGIQRAAEAELEAEIHEELRAHLEEARDALVESGLDPLEAEERALARFGDFESTLHHCIAERRQTKEPMKATVITLAALLGGAILFSLFQSRRLAAEQALAEVRMHELAAKAEREHLRSIQRGEPRPVIYRLGDTLQFWDIDRSGPGGEVHVAEDGMALFPDLGWVTVYGKQREDLEAELQERYEPFYDDLQEIVVERKLRIFASSVED